MFPSRQPAVKRWLRHAITRAPARLSPDRLLMRAPARAQVVKLSAERASRGPKADHRGGRFFSPQSLGARGI